MHQHADQPEQNKVAAAPVAHAAPTLSETEHRQVARGLTVSLVGLAGTLLLFGAAMLAFPGGHERMADGYSFSRHFLSAMGVTRVSNGTPNLPSCLMFNAALVLVGATFVFFWRARVLLVRNPAARRTLRLCGILMALGLAGIGLTPYDHLPHVHDRMNGLVIVCGGLGFMLCLFFTERRFERWRSRLVWLTVVALAGSVDLAIRWMVHAGHLPERPALPIMQKVFVALLMAWVAWQCVLFRRTSRPFQHSRC